MELVRYWLTLKVEFNMLRNEYGPFVALDDPTEVDWSGESSKRFYWSFNSVCRGRVVIMVNVSGPRLRASEYCVDSWHLTVPKAPPK